MAGFRGGLQIAFQVRLSEETAAPQLHPRCIVRIFNECRTIHVHAGKQRPAGPRSAPSAFNKGWLVQFINWGTLQQIFQAHQLIMLSGAKTWWMGCQVFDRRRAAPASPARCDGGAAGRRARRVAGGRQDVAVAGGRVCRKLSCWHHRALPARCALASLGLGRAGRAGRAVVYLAEVGLRWGPVGPRRGMGPQCGR